MMTNDRKRFDHPGADIIMHADGSLTIEAEADYGDSERGWGTAWTCVLLTPDQVVALISFLGDASYD